MFQENAGAPFLLVYFFFAIAAMDILKSLPGQQSDEWADQVEEERLLEIYRRNRYYLPLQVATIRGDWERFIQFLEQEPNAVRVTITEELETALFLAVRSSKRNNFLKKLLEIMTPDDVAIRDIKGRTALHRAVGPGNIEAVKMLVNKNPNLPNIARHNGRLPIFSAGNREMFMYLYSVTREELAVFGPQAHALMYRVTNTLLYDIALMMLQRNPALALHKPSPLEAMTYKSSSFRSGNSLTFLQNMIYSRMVSYAFLDCSNVAGVSIRLENNEFQPTTSDIEKSASDSSRCWMVQLRHRVNLVVWSFAEKFVPYVRKMRDLKLLHHQAIELVKGLCTEVANSEYSKETTKSIGDALIRATYVGIREIVEEILIALPSAINVTTNKKQHIFQYAIVCRRQTVFNLIYQFQECSHKFLSRRDERRNNGLHLAGHLTPYQQLRLRDHAAGAALQMQRECQWFRELENISLPQDKEERNEDDLTPYEVFSESHKTLVKEGEDWLKETANSCTILAVLMFSIMFGGAIAVPGGVKEGIPIFLGEKAFIVFSIFDAISLFSSATSLLIFMSIITSRYGEEDFLYTLPNRLIFGLTTLFVAILSMMVAFGCVLYLVYDYKEPWAFVPLILFASVPIFTFAGLQFPLLVEMTRATYGRGIFGKQSDRMIY